MLENWLASSTGGSRRGGLWAHPSDASDNNKAPRSLRILIADDERDSVLSLMMLLRSEGHETLGVYNGLQAMAALSHFEPDAVLLDIAMPGLSGWEVVATMRERWGTRRGPLIIGISGLYKQSADKILSKLAGLDHYLVKPYAPDDLLALLAPLKNPGHGSN